MAAAGIAPQLAELQAPWSARIDEDLRAATLHAPAGSWPTPGTASAACTPSTSAHLLADMQHLQRTYPGRALVSCR